MAVTLLPHALRYTCPPPISLSPFSFSFFLFFFVVVKPENLYFASHPGRSNREKRRLEKIGDSGTKTGHFDFEILSVHLLLPVMKPRARFFNF